MSKSAAHYPKESAMTEIQNGTQIRLTRTLRDGRTVAWTGELVGQGPMTVGGAEMGYVVLRTERGRECFALDPTFATQVTSTDIAAYVTDKYTPWVTYQRFWSVPLQATVVVERDAEGHCRSRTEKGAR